MAEIIVGGRIPRDGAFYTENDFSMAIYSHLGPRMLKDRDFCEDVWSALTNATWEGRGDVYAYTFRAAGDLVASILDEGDYTDWYFGTPGHVTADIEKLLGKAGFKVVSEA